MQLDTLINLNTKAAIANNLPSSPPIITKGDIRKIKDYVSTAKSLPVDIPQIQQLLKAENTGIAGLEPHDIASLHTIIRTHANAWSDVELSMKKVNASLLSFAEDLNSFGQGIIEAIETMPGYVDYLGTIKDLTEEEIQKLPPLELGSPEKNRFTSIKESFEFIARSIDERKVSSTEVQFLLENFRSDLTNQVSVGIGSTLNLAGNHDLNEQITRLNAQIDKAQQLIEEKTRETDFNFFDYIVLLTSPTGSVYFRVKTLLQNVHLAPLLRQRDELTAQVKLKHVLTGTLQELQNDLDSLSIYVSGATASTALLETLWVNTSDYIASSKNKIDRINEFLSLRSFVTALRVVLKNWNNIHHNAKALIAAFD